MKTTSLICMGLFAVASVFAQPSPHNDKEKKESKKEAKIARMKTKENNKRYRHEAHDKKKFNNM